jgi:hypothetical protein
MSISKRAATKIFGLVRTGEETRVSEINSKFRVLKLSSANYIPRYKNYLLKCMY